MGGGLYAPSLFHRGNKMIKIERNTRNAHLLDKLEIDADVMHRNGVTYKAQLLDALESNLNLRREVLRLSRSQSSLETVVKAIGK